MITLEEYAAVVGCSRTTAYKAAREGTVPTIRNGRALRVPTAYVRDLIGLTIREGA